MTVPFSHSLSFLAKNACLYDYFSEEQKDFIDMLEPLNVEARYPTNKDALMKSLTEDRCKSILTKTRELQEWIKQKL
jgi:HEPN domain-containing protein